MTAGALAAVTGTIADADGLGTLSFQWQKDAGTAFTDIPGATEQSLALTDAVRGARVRVVVSYVDGKGTQESVTSDAVLVPTTRAGAVTIRKLVAGAPGGRSTATVKWAAPEVTGGAPIDGYRVVALKVRKDGSTVRRYSTVVGADTRAIKVVLDQGRYRFKVRAINENGLGAVVVTKVVKAG